MADFLRKKRHEVDPTTAGIHVHGKRRTPGLRREDVAYLSGISQTWYTWLEQGRAITPSDQVLNSLARVLQMSQAEHQYILSLTGYATEQARSDSSPMLPDHGQRLLDAFGCRASGFLAGLLCQS
ncbi:MAG: helix-turn-helix domain-containing protein [Actinophytocola sp.]|nr:helix-turn-helix domain-containing protein [Actinophytocola sp.]